MYWNWHSIHNGYETYWKGLLSHDFDRNPAYDEACVIGNEWKKAGGEKLILKKRNEVAILIDNHSLTSFKWFPIDRDLSYNDVVRSMYDSLYEMNVECDLIHTEDILSGKVRLSHYKMVVTPALYCVEEALTEQLKTFVKQGGTLVSSFKSFVSNRDVKVYHDAQPHNLTECFGMSYNQFTEPGRAKVNGEEIKYFSELLKPTTAEALYSYEHPYWKNYAAVTKNSYGAGTAVYVGAYLSKNLLKKVYKEALEAAGISLCGEAWPVIIRSGVNERANKVHYILHYSEENREIICPYEGTCDLLTGKQYQKGDTILLKDWDVCVLEER